MLLDIFNELVNTIAAGFLVALGVGVLFNLTMWVWTKMHGEEFNLNILGTVLSILGGFVVFELAVGAGLYIYESTEVEQAGRGLAQRAIEWALQKLGLTGKTRSSPSGGTQGMLDTIQILQAYVLAYWPFRPV